MGRVKLNKSLGLERLEIDTFKRQGGRESMRMKTRLKDWLKICSKKDEL